MLLFLDTALSAFMLWLTAHTSLAYYVLFLGGYFETLIGTCFFVPGELFLLSGSILAGTHALSLPLVLLALYGGAILGDSSSYFIGRRVGDSIFKEGRRFLSLENHAKGEALFAKYGLPAIFFARLLGPLSWITPFMSGVYNVPYRKFLPYNLAGIFVGVGEFIVAGYFFGHYASLIFPVMHRYLFFIGFLCLGLGAFVFYSKRARAKKGTRN